MIGPSKVYVLLRLFLEQIEILTSTLGHNLSAMGRSNMSPSLSRKENAKTQNRIQDKYAALQR